MEKSLKDADELYQKGKNDEAKEIYKEVIQKGNTKQIAYAIRRLGLIALDNRNFDDALDYFEKSLEVTREINDKAAEGSTLGNMGMAYKQKGENEKALEYFEKSRKIHEEIGDKKNLAQDYCGKAMIYGNLTKFDEAFESMEKSLDIFDELNDEANMANVIFNRGNLYRLKGEPNNAKKDYEKALEISEKIEINGKEQFVEHVKKILEDLGGE